MNKKILFSLGTVTAAPVFAVVACSPGTNMNTEDVNFLKALKSNSTVSRINNL